MNPHFQFHTKKYVLLTLRMSLRFHKLLCPSESRGNLVLSHKSTILLQRYEFWSKCGVWYCIEKSISTF